MLSLVVAGWFLRRSGSRVSIPMACRRISAMALSLCEIPMPSRTTRKSTRPRASDRSMVATPHNHNGLPRFQDPLGVVATNKKMQLLRWNTSGHNATRAPLRSVGLDIANQTRSSGAGRKMFLTYPLIDQAITLKSPQAADLRAMSERSPAGMHVPQNCRNDPSLLGES
jgi:hypothetical protein